MKYLHGERTFLFEHEKNMLDRAIDRYDSLATKYYSKSNDPSCDSPDVRDSRKRELADIKHQLECQRLSLDHMASIQTQLDAYREQGAAATQGSRQEGTQKQKGLLAEGHHGNDLGKLEKYMQATGNPKPDSRHTAHHIVPGKGKTRFANLSRVHMHRFGIRINDPGNGVWLPTYAKYTPLWSMPESKGHLEYHTHGYEQWVRKKINAKSSEPAIRMELTLIGKMLQENNLPPEAK